MEKLASAFHVRLISLARVRKQRLYFPRPWMSHRLIWGFASLFLGVYAILQDLNIPLMVQPQLFGFLAFVCWGQVRVLFLS
jgi:hypothetical protein